MSFASATVQCGTHAHTQKDPIHHITSTNPFGGRAGRDPIVLCVRANGIPLPCPPTSSSGPSNPSPVVRVHSSIPQPPPPVPMSVRLLWSRHPEGCQVVSLPFTITMAVSSQQPVKSSVTERWEKRLTCSTSAKATAISYPARPRAWRAPAPARAPRPAASAPPRSWAAAARSAGRPCGRPRSC